MLLGDSGKMRSRTGLARVGGDVGGTGGRAPSGWEWNTAQVLGRVPCRGTFRIVGAGDGLVSIPDLRRAGHRWQVSGIRASGLAPVPRPSPVHASRRSANRPRRDAGGRGAPAPDRPGRAVRLAAGRRAVGGEFPVLAGLPPGQGCALPLPSRLSGLTHPAQGRRLVRCPGVPFRGQPWPSVNAGRGLSVQPFQSTSCPPWTTAHW